MEIFLDYRELPSFHQGTVMTVGNFDGVHVGHRTLLKALRTMANDKRTQTLVFTFDPHTQKYFKGITHYLTPNWYKLELLKSLGVDVVLLQNFNAEFQNLTKDEFLQQVLKETLAIQGIVIGPDIHFGKGGKGTKDDIITFCDQKKIHYLKVDPIHIEGQPISSSGLRARIQDGRVESMDTYLARPYTIKGKVIKGAGRGTPLGFPTANVDYDAFILPKDGVYSAIVTIDETKQYKGAVSIGTNPTFGDTGRFLEVYILKFKKRIYNKIIDVAFIHRLRDQIAFPSVEALKEAIQQDAKEVDRVIQL